MNGLYAVFGVPLCAVYSNTLLANLNAELYVRGETATHNVDADLFNSSSSPASDSARTEKLHGVALVVPSAYQVGFTVPSAVMGLSHDDCHGREFGRSRRW